MRKRTAFAAAVVAQDGQQVNWRKLWLRAAVSLLASAVFVWLLAQRLAHIDLGELVYGFQTIAAQNWVAALGLTLISFAAVGHYDVVMHRHFNSPVAPAAARRAGICAIAVSQTLGLGLITGSILRWRMLPQQSLWASTRLTAAVAGSFLLGWAFVSALTLALLPNAPFRPIAVLVLAALCLAAALALFAPRLLRALPNAQTLGRLIILTAIDTFAAAAALWVLCPTGTEISFAALLPAFLLAFGAGLVSGAPGGVGPFEMALLALLPDQPEPALLTAVLAWRLCYFALPAVIGAVIAIKGAGPSLATPPLSTRPLLTLPRRAELGLAHQGQHRLMPFDQSSGMLIGRTHHFMIGLFDPVASPTAAALTACLAQLRQRAKAASCSAAIYKSGNRLAAVARANGFTSLRIATEASLALTQFDLATPSRANLRRKLRKARAAGISITQARSLRDCPDLAGIATAWAQSHGGERGFSMGRFCPDYLAHQRLYVAWKDARPIAFASFHLAASEWTLDLMRHADDLPDGTMHALIHQAIEDARAAGIARLSLAAVPDCGATHWLAQRLFQRVQIQAAGLTQFKSAFDPQWQPLYLIARNRLYLCIAALEIAREIHAPPPLSRPKMREIEQDYAHIEFASDAHTWHRQTE